MFSRLASRPFRAYNQIRTHTNDKRVLMDYLQSRKSFYMLPQEFYSTKFAFKSDLKHVWHKTWLVAGYDFQIKNPGEYFTFQIGNENAIIIRDDNGDIKAFHNLCIH